MFHAWSLKGQRGLDSPWAPLSYHRTELFLILLFSVCRSSGGDEGNEPVINSGTSAKCNHFWVLQRHFANGNKPTKVDWLSYWGIRYAEPSSFPGCVCVCCRGVLLEKLGSYLSAAQAPWHSRDPTQPNSSSETASCMKGRNSSGAFQILQMA